MLRRWFIILGIALACPHGASAEAKCGVVFMHGKWGNPSAHIAGAANQLRAVGCVVETPEMPWSGRRRYDAPASVALQEIDAAIARLKAQGATAIFVGGQSMGASAALAYGARHPGLRGILAVSPGHDPALSGFADKTAGDVQRARSLVSQGRGTEVIAFTDLNGGRTASFSAPASTYLSYFDPAGLFVIPENAKRLSAPLLWVSGNADPLTRLGQDYAFTKAPADPHNRYIVVAADHLGAPDAAASQIAAWVRGLVQ
jgi:dienelactone hydrolase